MALKRSTEHPVNVYYGYQTIGEFQRSRRLEGPFRVFVFCLLAIVLPCVLLVIPLYLRYEFYKDVTYHLGESDLVTVDQPISTIWCSEQELRMNATFHAYLLNQQPEISEDLKQIEMQKHMQLADDTLEYWGFFLLQGSKVTLSVCSRFDGARLMVVKGAKNLKHCALVDPSREDQIDPWEEDVSAPQGEKIKVTFQQGEIQTLSAQPPKKTKPMRNDSQKVTPLPNVSIHVDQSTDVKEGASRYASNRSRRGGGSRLTVATPPISNTRPASRSENSTNQGRHTGISRESWKVLRSRNGSRKRRFIMTEAEPSGNSPTVDEAEDEAPPPVGVEADVPEAFDEEDIRSSGSSFAKNLWSCYGGDTLFTQTFSPSPRCQSQEAMMKYVRMKMVHEVTSTGYYYYIFYSDNDILSNDIFARFNIEKVEYRFPNYTNSCLNSTHCTLPLSFFSSEKVLLEVPIQDGVSDEDALAQIILISSCKPRHAVYIIFPVAILLIFILCAFI